MKTAEMIYNNVSDDADDRSDIEAMHECISFEDFTLGDVSYTKYHFADKSWICFGSNGYVGCEY